MLVDEIRSFTKYNKHNERNRLIRTHGKQIIMYMYVTTRKRAQAHISLILYEYCCKLKMYKFNITCIILIGKNYFKL